MAFHRFYLNFNPKDKRNKLSRLPAQDLKTIYDLTQKQTTESGEVVEPILYFAGPRAQQSSKHFKLFNKYYSNSGWADNYEQLSDQTLLERFSIGFDSNDGDLEMG